MQSLTTGLLFPIIGVIKSRIGMEDSWHCRLEVTRVDPVSQAGIIGKIEKTLGTRKG